MKHVSTRWTRHAHVIAAAGLLASVLALVARPAGAFPGSTERVSVDSAGNQSVGPSIAGPFASPPSISADGRFVAFAAWARNLASGDTNGFGDVFVHDRGTGVTERLSVDGAGTEANDTIHQPAISGDGRFVAFVSAATNLVPGDTNAQSDVFVHDRQTRTTERASVSSAGIEGRGWSDRPAISADGRFVAFVSAAPDLVPGDTNGRANVFVHDRQTRTTERVSTGGAGTQADGESDSPAISADGRFVAFVSAATNLVPGDTSGRAAVFVYDRQTRTTERVSVDGAGTPADRESASPTISADGRFVAFSSSATNLVPGDSNGQSDVFVHDRQTGTIERVSVDSAGTEADGWSDRPAISASGRFVAFCTLATNLVPGDTNGQWDELVHDRQTRTTERASVDSAGTEANASSHSPSISAGGRFVVFASDATNLVPGDTNGVRDVFVRDRGEASGESAISARRRARLRRDALQGGIQERPEGAERVRARRAERPASAR
jgi:Tol biopolymer transport system component